MEKRESYSVKDIILGSRDEYKNVEKYLFMLRYLCYVYNDKVRDFYFVVSKIRSDEKPKLVCRFVQETASIRGLIISIQKKLKKYDLKREVADCVRYPNGQYLVKNADFRLCIGDRDAFSDTADELLSLDFVNKMNFGLMYYDKSDETTIKDLIVYPNKIELSMLDSNNHVRLGYYPFSDSICMDVEGSGKTIFGAIKEALEFEIPAECLSQYHRELIDSNPIIYRPLEIISEFSGDHSNIEFTINDSSKDKVVLRRIKNEKRY